MTRAPGVTVVLPTWNRPDGLRRALAGLAAQRSVPVPWDVVVVASASDPAAHRVVGALAPEGRLGGAAGGGGGAGAGGGAAGGGDFAGPDGTDAGGGPDAGGPAARVVDEPQPGASNARNRGLSASRAVVAFLDDDCVPAPEWLRRVSAPVLAGTWAWCGGRVGLDAGVRRPRWLGSALFAYLAEYDRGGVEGVLADDDFVLTANAAFDAELLSRAGGFDPALGPNAGRPMVDDDVDVCRKVRRLGGTIGYAPDAVVEHELPAARLSPGYVLRRMHAQGRSDWLLDRDGLAARRDRGIGLAAAQLGREQRSILRQGPWHASVALHSVGSAVRAAGFAREAMGGGGGVGTTATAGAGVGAVRRWRRRRRAQAS